MEPLGTVTRSLVAESASKGLHDTLSPPPTYSTDRDALSTTLLAQRDEKLKAKLVPASGKQSAEALSDANEQDNIDDDDGNSEYGSCEDEGELGPSIRGFVEHSAANAGVPEVALSTFVDATLRSAMAHPEKEGTRYSRLRNRVRFVSDLIADYEGALAPAKEQQLLQQRVQEEQLLATLPQEPHVASPAPPAYSSLAPDSQSTHGSAPHDPTQPYITPANSTNNSTWSLRSFPSMEGLSRSSTTRSNTSRSSSMSRSSGSTSRSRVVSLSLLHSILASLPSFPMSSSPSQFTPPWGNDSSSYSIDEFYTYDISANTYSCRHPSCLAAAANPMGGTSWRGKQRAARHFGVYHVNAKKGKTSIIKRAREHTLKHLKRDWEEQERKKGGANGRRRRRFSERSSGSASIRTVSSRGAPAEKKARQDSMSDSTTPTASTSSSSRDSRNEPFTLAREYIYSDGAWRCQHPACLVTPKPGQRVFGVYVGPENCPTSVVKRAREHWERHLATNEKEKGKGKPKTKGKAKAVSFDPEPIDDVASSSAVVLDLPVPIMPVSTPSGSNGIMRSLTARASQEWLTYRDQPSVIDDPSFLSQSQSENSSFALDCTGPLSPDPSSSSSLQFDMEEGADNTNHETQMLEQLLRELTNVEEMCGLSEPLDGPSGSACLGTYS